ncbi:ABC transporter permease [Nocardioides humi]|uniref:ABC transporter permease n=1 Tax=Nocardioides humi TaxID=449461 RepID=UPI0015E84884|nr:ABC transporter permease [Nocardioides humi]
MPHRIVGLAAPVGYFALVMTVWESAVRLLHVAPLVLPAPSAVARALADNAQLLLHHSRVTVVEAMIGLGIALVAAVLLAGASAASPLVHRMLYPSIVVFEAAPKVALAPLLVIWFGLGLSSKVATVAIMCFFAIYVATFRGLNSVDGDQMDLVRSLRATRREVFLRVRLPVAVPHFFTGLKIAVPGAMIGAVVGEFVTAQAGLGYLVLQFSQYLDTTRTLAAIAVVTLWSGLLYRLVVAAESAALRRFAPGSNR